MPYLTSFLALQVVIALQAIANVAIIYPSAFSHTRHPFLPSLAPQVVIPLQAIANVAIIYLDEFTPAAESWFT